MDPVTVLATGNAQNAVWTHAELPTPSVIHAIRNAPSRRHPERSEGSSYSSRQDLTGCFEASPLNMTWCKFQEFTGFFGASPLWMTSHPCVFQSPEGTMDPVTVLPMHRIQSHLHKRQTYCFPINIFVFSLIWRRKVIHTFYSAKETALYT